MKKLLVLLIIALSVSGCSATEPNAKEIIGVSIVPQETFAKAILGESYEVVTLIPPGSSPTSHQPSIRTLQKLSEAKLYFSIGVETEEANILPTIKEYDNLEIIDLAKAVDEIYPARFFEEDEEDHDAYEGEEENHDHDGRDPHIWLSPKRAIAMVEIMTEELIKTYPEDKALFIENKEKYKEKLIALDKYIQSKVKNANTKDFIIYHPSYGYLADDYGLNMIEIETDGKAANINRLDEIAKIAKEKNINAVYYQEEMSFKQAEIIANEIDGEIVKLTPLSADYIEGQKNFIDTLVGE